MHNSFCLGQSSVYMDFAVKFVCKLCCKSLAKGLLSIYTMIERLVVYMPNIKPVSDLRNYTSVISEVGYGERVYLTKNGHGNITLIDMKELDDIENELALYKFKYEMAMAEKSIREEGTISADDLEKDLGVL